MSQLTLFTATEQPPIRKIELVRNENKEAKHKSVRDRFNELKAIRVEGISLDYDEVIRKISKEFYIAERTVSNILKGRN